MTITTCAWLRRQGDGRCGGGFDPGRRAERTVGVAEGSAEGGGGSGAGLELSERWVGALHPQGSFRGQPRRPPPPPMHVGASRLLNWRDPMLWSPCGQSLVASPLIGLPEPHRTTCIGPRAGICADPRVCAAGLLPKVPDVLPSRQSIARRTGVDLSGGCGWEEYDAVHTLWLDEAVGAILAKLRSVQQEGRVGIQGGDAYPLPHHPSH